jgi:NitT/TauT family transport system substrate-binding protein
VAVFTVTCLEADLMEFATTKRGFLTAATLGAGLAALPGFSAARAAPRLSFNPGVDKTYRMMMNTYPTIDQGWLHLAEDRGYVKQAGLDLLIQPGRGAWLAPPAMYAGSYDFGFGDINSMLEVVAENTGDNTPIGVFMMFNASPATIVVRADGPIKTPADLKGKTIASTPDEVGRHTLGAFFAKTGIDPASVKQTNMRDQVAPVFAALQAGTGPDAIMAYNSSIHAGLVLEGIDPDKNLRYINFVDYVPELYGSCLMASRRMVRDHPEVVRALVGVVNRGLHDMVNDPSAALEATMKRLPSFFRDCEAMRLKQSLKIEMGNPESRRIGMGDVDDTRLAKSIALQVRGNRLPRTPSVSEIFDRRFLPPHPQRVTRLGG